MARVQCNCCGAIYDTVQADGMLYFHACAPLSSVELAAAVTAGKVTLPPKETAGDAVLARTYERANKRNENRVIADGADKSEIIAAGDGTKAAPARSANTLPVVTVDV
jgi:hypothetical protein